MRNIRLVLKHDIGVILRQRSFWLLTFLMPALLLALNTFVILQDSGLGKAAGDGGAESAGESVEDAEADRPPTIGLVDEAGLIAEIPPAIPAGLIVRFAGDETALAALEAGEIEQYIVVPDDYVDSGALNVYDENFRIQQGEGNTGIIFDGSNAWVLQYLIAYNITGDEGLVRALADPIPGALVEHHVLDPDEEGGQGDQALALVVASILPYVYYFLLLIGSSYLMRSVVAEKENRTAEVLLTSLQPRELMAGKIGAMSVITIIQMVIWLGGGLLILNRGAEALDVSAFTFPPGFFVWASLFLILGFLVYASAMAAAGAIAPNAREGSQMTWLMIVPLLPTLMFAQEFLENPDGTLAVVLSLFPLSAPAAMTTRLAVGDVPTWQVMVSLAGLTITAYLFLALAARFFRAGNLLADTPFSWKRVATGWRG
jgi:ABC-2 type transport system permease protein